MLAAKLDRLSATPATVGSSVAFWMRSVRSRSTMAFASPYLAR
jgi:hypothetical protein